MTEDDRKPFHAFANNIAKTAREEIKVLAAQIRSVLPNLSPRLALGGAPRFLDAKQVQGIKECFSEIEAKKNAAKKDIQAVMDWLPDHADNKDIQAIQDDAHKILDGRGDVINVAPIDYTDKGTLSLYFNLNTNKGREIPPEPFKQTDVEFFKGSKLTQYIPTKTARTDQTTPLPDEDKEPHKGPDHGK